MPYNPFDRNQSTAPMSAATSPTTAPEMLKRAMDCKLKGVMFHSKASRTAHMWGLQGQKRWHRWQMHTDFCELVKLQHYLIDQFGENYEPHVEDDLPPLADLEAFFRGYQEYESRYYTIMSDIANQLTLANYSNEAHMIREMLEGVSKEFEKCRRWLQDYQKANWAWSYVRVMDDKLHDKIKDKEDYCS